MKVCVPVINLLRYLLYIEPDIHHLGAKNGSRLSSMFGYSEVASTAWVGQAGAGGGRERLVKPMQVGVCGANVVHHTNVVHEGGPQ